MSAKIEGQERSLATLTEATWDAFKLVLTTVPPGALFTVNTVRVFLDWADIPVEKRGGLFARAARAGMMAPAMHSDTRSRPSRATWLTLRPPCTWATSSMSRRWGRALRALASGSTGGRHEPP